MHFQTYPKWGKTAEWITRYPPPTSIVIDSWLIDQEDAVSFNQNVYSTLGRNAEILPAQDENPEALPASDMNPEASSFVFQSPEASSVLKQDVEHGNTSGSRPEYQDVIILE